MDMKDVCRRIACDTALSWYDESHMKDLKEWMIDEILDMSSFHSTKDQLKGYIESAKNSIIKKLEAVAEYMADDIVNEVKDVLDDMIKEGYNDEEQEE